MLHLARVDLFAGLPAEVRRRFATHAELCSFSPNQPIVAQGDPCDAFYLVRGGYVKVARRRGRPASFASPTCARATTPAKSACCSNEPWPFTLTALEHVELVRIGRDGLRARARRPARASRSALWQAVVARLKERGFAVRNPRAVAVPADGDGHRPDPRRERAADRPEHLHALRRLRARLRRYARRHAALHPRRHPRLALQRADRLLPVHRSGLHDRLPDRRDHPAARHARGHSSTRTRASAATTASTAAPGTTSSRCRSQPDAGTRHRAGDQVRPLRRPRRRPGLRADVPARLGGACGLERSRVVRTLFA